MQGERGIRGLVWAGLGPGGEEIKHDGPIWGGPDSGKKDVGMAGLVYRAWPGEQGGAVAFGQGLARKKGRHAMLTFSRAWSWGREWRA